MNSYKVNIMDTKTGNGLGTVRVTCATKEEVPAEAAKAMVRTAKAYNAKYCTQGLPKWAFKSENHADYTAWGSIRKMPAKKVAA